MGQETEIDKVVAENLGDPLVHVIRNAIDHGIETPEERLKCGKTEAGVVEVMAFHEGNFLVIQITDDGKGIDGDYLLEKAIAKGLISKNSQLNKQQKIELIFHPGFSTKDQVSEVSGRGVGMDVVKTNIEGLGGFVKVRSDVGIGSSFRFILPLTLATIEGIVVESANHKYIVPKNQIYEVHKLTDANVSKITGRSPYLKIRDEILPIFYLDSELWNVTNSNSNIVIIVKTGQISFAVAIDDVLRQQQVVVKAPTEEMSRIKGIMGTTILGDGKASMIVDLIHLFSSKVRKEQLDMAV